MSIIIYPPASPVLVNVFNFPIRYYGLIMALSFALGVIVSYFLFKHKFSKEQADLFFDYSPMVILISIIGARIFYVLGDFNFYLKFPKEIIMINHGGLSIFGALFFGILSLYIFSKKRNFNLLPHADVLAVVLPLCQSIGRFGNYFNQEAYGEPSSGLIKLFVSPFYRTQENINIEFYHPTFLYESILDLIVFLVLLRLFIKYKNARYGSFACIYLVLYSIIRFLIEHIRIDSVLNVSDIPIAQIISIVVLIVAFTLFILINKKRTLK